MVLGEFEKTETGWETAIRTLSREIELKDPPVASMLENSARKIFYQLNKVKRRLISNQGVRDSDTSRQISYLLNQLVPRKQFQERVINFACFHETEGKQLLDRLISRADPFNRVHQLIYL